MRKEVTENKEFVDNIFKHKIELENFIKVILLVNFLVV